MVLEHVLWLAVRALGALRVGHRGGGHERQSELVRQGVRHALRVRRSQVRVVWHSQLTKGQRRLGRLPVMCVNGCVGTVVETCGHGSCLTKASLAVAPRQLSGRATCDPRHVGRKTSGGRDGSRLSGPLHSVMMCGRRRVALSGRRAVRVRLIYSQRKEGWGGLSSLPPQGPPPAPDKRFR